MLPPLVSLSLVAALAAILAADLLTPPRLSPAPLAILVALAAGWLLPGRWAAAVAAAGVAAVLFDLVNQQLTWLTALSTIVGVVAVTAGASAGSRSVLASREVAAREAAVFARTSDVVAGSAALDPTLHEVVRAAAESSIAPDGGPRRASLLRLSGDRVSLVADYDEAGSPYDAGLSASLSSMPPAARLALESGLPQVALAAEAGEPVRREIARSGGRSIAYARVTAEGDLFGLLTVVSRSATRFDEAQLEVLRAVADLAGLAIASAQLRERLHLGLDLALDVGSSLDPRQVASRLMSRIVDSVQAERATLSRMLADEVEIVAVFDRDRSDPLSWAGSSYPLALLQAQPTVWRAIAERRALTGPGLDAEAAEEAFQEHLRPVRHVLTLPLVAQDRVEGSLVLSRRRDEPFSEADVRTVQQFSAVSALALRNSWAFADAEHARSEAAEHARRLQLALDAAEEVGSLTDLDEVTRRLLARACDALQADSGAICSLDREELRIERAQGGEGADAASGTRLQAASVPEIVRALASRRIVRCPPSKGSPLNRPGDERDAIRHSLQCPLIVTGEPVGVLAVGRYEDRPFTEADELSLQHLAPLTALLLQSSRLLKEARDLSRSRSDFLNTAAHELRTPLSVVRGYAALLEEGSLGAPTESQASGLRVLADKAQELDRIVESLLVAARLQAGATHIRPQPVELEDVVTAAMRRAEPRLRLSGSQLVLESLKGGIPVETDPDALGRVLDNLINNALSYSAAPAVVRITLAAGKHAEVRVADSGIGIPEAYRERIFEPFFRLDEAEAPRPGAGLGLAISRDLAQRIGGRLELESSSPGKGSVFLLTLPLSNLNPG